MEKGKGNTPDIQEFKRKTWPFRREGRVSTGVVVTLSIPEVKKSEDGDEVGLMMMVCMV